MNPERALDAACRAAGLAGRAIMPEFGRPVGLRYKTPDQPVTNADLVADRMLQERLLAIDARAGWLSEETADDPSRRRAEHVWVVDPIDGTERFIDGIPEFGISVALLEQGEVVLAVVHNPATEETFHAIRGRGAFRNGVRLAPPSTAATEQGVLLVSRSELAAGDFTGFEGNFELRVVGSTSYKMAQVALGAGDAYLSRRRKGEWDVCAGALLVAEAGRRVSDAQGMDLRFNQADPTVRGVLVGIPTVCQRVLRQLEIDDSTGMAREHRE
jgi:myo-inositol-1(or 4)-monophosphatase